MFPKPKGPITAGPGSVVLDPNNPTQPLYTVPPAPREPDRELVEVVDPKNPNRTIMVPRAQAVGMPGKSNVERGGPFQGNGMEAQAWNILLKGQTDTPEYAAAYSHITTPKQTVERNPETGQPMLVTIAPQIPAGIKPPTYRPPAGAPQAAPAAAPAMPPQEGPAPAPAAPVDGPQPIAPGVTATPLPGMGGKSPEKLTPKQQEAGMSLNKLGGAVQALMDDVNANGMATGGWGAKGGRQSALYKDVLMQLKNAQDLGVLNGRDEILLLEQMSDPTGFYARMKGFGGPSYFNAQMQALVEKINRERSYLPEAVLKPDAAPKMTGASAKADLAQKYGVTLE
jgi:hypothetical protein